jgi:hypothetical protein
MSDELPTIAARVLMRAERVRDEVLFVSPEPATPELSEKQGREYGPLLAELCRLAVAEWRRPEASPTPQNLSNVLIRISDTIKTAWVEEDANELS